MVLGPAETIRDEHCPSALASQRPSSQRQTECALRVDILTGSEEQEHVRSHSGLLHPQDPAVPGKQLTCGL